jgi:predicted secreted protein
MRPVRRAVLAVAGLSLLMSLPAQAQTSPPPENVVHLSASASTEVPNDLLTVVFSTRREGPEAAVVQSQLKQALDAALAEARRAAEPGRVEVRTGGFSLAPRYLPKGGTSGWTGQAELIVSGRDAQAVADLTGRIQTMTIARVGWSLSTEARAKVEDGVTAEAVAAFRAKADRTARQFGFTGWLLREANLGGEGPRPYAQPLAMARAAAAEMDAPLPVEGGKATVSATVSGSVQLTR